MSYEAAGEQEPGRTSAFEGLSSKLSLAEGVSEVETQEIRNRVLAEIEDWERMGFVKAEVIDSLVESIRFEESPSRELLAQYGIEKASGSWNPQAKRWTIYGEFFRQDNEARRHIGLHEIMGHALIESGIFSLDKFTELQKLAKSTVYEDESPYVQGLLNQYDRLSGDRATLETAARRAEWDSPDDYLNNLRSKILMEKLAERLSGWFEHKRELVPGDTSGEFARIFASELGTDDEISAKLSELERHREEEIDEEMEEELLEQQRRMEELRAGPAPNPAQDLSKGVSEKTDGELFEPPVTSSPSALGWIFAPIKEALTNF